MRLGFIQTAPNLPRFEDQATAISGFEPDDYFVARFDSTKDWQRLQDRLDLMKRNDALCVASLDVFLLDTPLLEALLEQLLDRGVLIRTLDTKGYTVVLGDNRRDRELIGLLAACHVRLEGAIAPPRKGRAARLSPVLLTEDQIDEIRELHENGLTPRQIGQIFRRSPNCIAAILAGARPTGRDVADQPHRYHLLHIDGVLQKYVTLPG